MCKGNIGHEKTVFNRLTLDSVLNPVVSTAVLCIVVHWGVLTELIAGPFLVISNFTNFTTFKTLHLAKHH